MTGILRVRRFLIKNEHGKLPYPEGTACAEVLRATVASEREEADAEVECVRVDEDGDLALTAFVEEEILLALPEFTRHDPADCPVRLEDFAAPDAPPRESPFAVLAELKRDN